MEYLGVGGLRIGFTCKFSLRIDLISYRLECISVISSRLSGVGFLACLLLCSWRDLGLIYKWLDWSITMSRSRDYLSFLEAAVLLNCLRSVWYAKGSMGMPEC